MARTPRNIGHIRRTAKTGWRVNPIVVRKGVDSHARWECAGTGKYVVIIPSFGSHLGKKVAVVRPNPRTRRASLRIPSAGSRVGRHPYLILLKDRGRYECVQGGSAPIIIIRHDTA